MANNLPLEFTLLGRILWFFRERQADGGWVICTRTELTRRFLYERTKSPLTPEEFYHRVLPGWIRRGLAREVPRPGKPCAYAFRLMTLDEINARLRQIKRLHDPLLRLYNNRDRPEYQHPDIYDALWPLQAEADALKIERRARLEESLSAPAGAGLT